MSHSIRPRTAAGSNILWLTPRSVRTPSFPLRCREASVLEMIWYCDACRMKNICDVSGEPRFFAVILMAKRDHESISPSCEWDPIRIHGWLFRPRDSRISLEHSPACDAQSLTSSMGRFRWRCTAICRWASSSTYPPTVHGHQRAYHRYRCLCLAMPRWRWRYPQTWSLSHH